MATTSQPTHLTAGARAVLDAASTLFYERGIGSVGVDAIAAHAGVTKKTIYDRFGSKAALVEAYLRARDDRFRAWVDERIAAARGSDRLLAVFDALASWLDTQSPLGCAFVHAHAELLAEPDHPAHAVIAGEKAWLLERFTALARDEGLADPHPLAIQLLALHEGATVLHSTAQANDAVPLARDAARALIERAG
ncbi:MAG TPA: helix-turn-helix domain-containing protein [Microbacterium sp.]|nr:helix-turn-helix domain-containing protein [Microbacterium sp.]